MEEILTEFQRVVKHIIEELKEELIGIRTGRANPALIENIKITTYQGTTTLRLLEIATITTQDPQTLLITPFDPSTITDIEEGLTKSTLGIKPIVQGHTLLVKIPPLTQEQREKYKKLVSQLVEEHREKMRKERDRLRKQVKTAFEEKQITEDNKYYLFNKLDELTKEFNQTFEHLKSKKLEELSEI